MPTAIDYLSTYLQDHRAGARAGSDLAARLRDENLGTPYEISDPDDRLDRAGLLGLVDRAESQLTGLREHHRMATREAFAD